MIALVVIAVVLLVTTEANSHRPPPPGGESAPVGAMPRGGNSGNMQNSGAGMPPTPRPGDNQEPHVKPGQQQPPPSG
ncbi:hypothetical protein COOONC_04905 [Cooperia oncophora]